MTARHALTRFLRQPITWLFAAVLAFALLGGQAMTSFGSHRASIPFPSLVYRIEATSGTHTASILNLPIGYVGALQAPVPVDVDGNLIPDVEVSVNLVDVQGIHNPPQVGDIIRPNIEINRYPLDLANVLLGQPSPPLRIDVALDVVDLQGQQPTMTARFGYDTAGGGSIPAYFQATVDGLTNFFNPVTATISTKGAIITQSDSPLWYRGPLTVIGGFQQGTFNADLGLKYSPFPDRAVVTYSHDSAGNHIDYSHDYSGDVDLLTNATITDGPSRTNVSALVQHLPRKIGVDLLNETNGGGIRYDSTADGRLPDVDVTYRGPLQGDVYNAHLNIEQLPNFMEAHWKMPTGGPMSASFDSSGQGIGAIEANIANKDGNPQGLPPFVFNEKQALAVQTNTATGGLRLGGRIERIRHLDIAQKAGGGFIGTVNVGDGELPLQLHAFLDLRSTGAPLLDADATFSPLPSGPQPGHPTFELTPAGSDQQANPLTFSYSSLESVDIDGHVLVRDSKAPAVSAPTDPATCGTTGVLCGDLRIRNIPTSLVTKIGEFKSPVNGKREMRVDVDADGPGHTDVFGDVKVGPDIVPSGTPISGRPLAAHVELLGIAKHVRVRTVEGQDDTLQRAEFHTCDFDYTTELCSDATKNDQIGALQFTLANFLAEHRNDPDVNVPSAYATTPNYATITARGHDNGNSVAFEATGRVQSIRELTYINDGAFGVRTNVGDNQPLNALVDIKDIALNGANGQHRANHSYDVNANVLIKPLPQKMSFCFNESGQEIVSPTSTITAPCQDKNPFSTDPNRAALAQSPMSLSYDGKDGNDNPQQIDEILVNGTLVDKGATPSDVSDDHTIRGHVDITNIPATIRAHFLDPKVEGGGPMRLLVDAPVQGPQLKVEASAAMLDADLQCQDPRVPASGQSALCAAATLNNLPTRVTMDYDPTVKHDNFVLDTAGDKQMDITGLSVSSVQRDDATGLAKVLVGEGQILGLPKTVKGTLVTPAPDQPDDPVNIDLTATPPLGSIDATVRNFIAPDPIPDMAAQRDGLPQPDDYASFIQRGDAFKGVVHITSVKRVGFANQVDANGKKLDTNLINVDFGKDKVIRGFVDLDPDGTNQILGDVTLTDVPAGIQLCFRGPKEAANADALAANPTFCDQQPRAAGDTSDPNTSAGNADTKALQQKVGAFEARMTPVDGPKKLDVHAFVRSAKGGGADVLAGKVDVIDIPNVIRGTFGDGKVDVGGYTLDGVPDGIAQIGAHVASFDIPDDGWTATTRPYAPRFVFRSPFPAPSSSNEYASLRADDSDFEARAQIGPQSQLHRIQVADSPCAKPVAVDYNGDGVPDADYGTRPDFPFFPTDDGSKYTCIRGDFKPTGASTVDPLDLSVVVQKGGKLLSLDQGRLDDIPEFFQVNLADANPVDTGDQIPDHQLRPTCVGGPANVQPAHCVAPLVRFDNPGNSTLSGVVEYGAPSDLAQLVTVQPREDQPNDLAAPTSWGEDGIRARVGSFTNSTAARAAFHLPIPASVTVDQVGTWSMQDLSSKANYRDASDLHFRFAARHDDGSTFDNLGRLSAFIHSFSDGSQILLSSEDPNVGFHIPGELGIDLYTRNHDGNGRNFIQIDGRSSSHDLSIRARMLGTGGSPIGRLDAQIRNVPPMQSLAYARDDDPSFRIRAEVMGDGKEPPDSSGSDPSSSSAPPKEDDCSPLLCVVTQVRVKSVNVQFDFKPGNAPDYARLLEAAIHTDGAKNGVEIRGNSKIDGTGDPARFLAGAQVVVDPINVFVHAGIPLLASFDLVNLASLDAAFSIGGSFANQLWDPGGFLSSGSNVPTLSGDGTTDFALRQNLVHITADSGGPGDSFIGPIDYNVTVLHGEAWALFVKLIGVDFVPEPGTLRMPYFDCQNPGAGIIESALGTFVVPGGGSASVVAWPFGTPPIVYSGLLGGPATLFGALAEPFFCLASTDQTLISDSPTDPHPSDPLGVTQTGSVVPDAKVSAVDVTTPPTPPTNPQLADYTAKSSVALCGTFTFRNISVPSGVTLHVADTPSSVDINGDPDDPNDNIPAACSASSTSRELTLIASGGVTVAGTIDAHALVHTTSATGNSGGGHGAGFWPLFGSGDGGDGGNSGTGGHRNGDLFDSLTSEVGEAGSAVGSPAGSGSAGAGGGLVKIIADTLSVTGDINADGDPGQSVTTGHCSVADDPNTTDVDESQPNTGKAGGGGGAGGGIVINVADFENSGTVHANGGAGGDGNAGAGGGGGGGNVKLSTALFGGSFPTASGGGAGANGCPDDFGDAGAGQSGNFQFNQAPKSRVDVSGLSGFGFWHSTQGDKTLTLPYSAASASSNNDMTVVLCATVKSPSLPQPTDTSLTNVLLPAVPTGVDIDHPCGTEPTSTDPSHIVSQPTYIARHYLQNTSRVDPPSATFDLTDLAEGYYGFYTVVWRSSDNNNDCFDWIDLLNSGDVFGALAEHSHDQGACSEPEEMPSSPDIVLGIDNTNPNMRAFTVHGTKVRNDDGSPVLDVQPVPTNTLDEQVVWNDDDNLSGVLGRDCSGDVTAIHAPPAPDVVIPDTNHPFRTCVSGQTVEVTNGDGTKTLAVRLTDAAGNEDIFHVDVLVDTTNPDSTGAPLTLPNRLNGWYSASPHFLLNGFDDHSGSGPADPAYQFQFDEGDQKGCLDAPAPAAPTCTIDGSPGHELPGLGRHVLHWSAVDKVGNQYTGDARPNLAVKIDGQPPTSALLSVPAAPNGANGWYSGPTWITFGAFDQPGGSGFTQAADDTANGKVSGVTFTVSYNGGPTIAHSFDPQHPVPFRLNPGQSHVCWQAEDQAGNIEAADPVSHCRDFKVDEGDPSATLSPGGSTTWSTSAVPVQALVSDAGVNGSGVAADTDPSTLCTPLPTIATSAPSGTCISIDGSPFVTTTHDKDVWSLGEGLHEVRTFATDRAGRRSAIRTELYKVDLSNPVAVARVIPAQPASGKWWRATPTVVLRAADGDRHGSGVASIQYKIAGSTSTSTYSGPCSATACTYTGPFTLPEGLYRVTYWATDNAGRRQADQVLHVAVDTTPPVAVATTPNPALWLRSSLGLPLTSPTVALRWTVQENLSGRADVDNSPVDKVHVQVVVYDAMGFPVRTLDAGMITVAPGQTYQGSTAWDGKGANLASLLPLGTYYYRVVATDAAGNQTMSGESQKLLIALSLL